MWSDEVRFIAANMIFVSSMVWNGVEWSFKKVIDQGFFFENIKAVSGFQIFHLVSLHFSQLSSTRTLI